MSLLRRFCALTPIYPQPECGKDLRSGTLATQGTGNRSCTLANDEIANNSSMTCCKIMNKAVILSVIITNLIELKTKVTFIQSIKKTMEAPIVFKEIKYAAKDKKDVPFFITNSGKRWAI